MNTFWLKLAGVAIVAIIALVVISSFRAADSTQKPAVAAEKKDEPQTFADVAKRDDARLRAAPQVKQEQPQEANKTTAQQTVPQFRQLTEEEQTQAEKLFEQALFHRKEARLPGLTGSFKMMVDYCREIIERFPGSEYAYKAKRMLGEVPQRFRKQYNITDEELKLN